MKLRKVMGALQVTREVMLDFYTPAGLRNLKPFYRRRSRRTAGK